LAVDTLSRMRAIVDKDGMPTQVMQLFSEQLRLFLLNPVFPNGITLGNSAGNNPETINFFKEETYLPEARGVTTPGTATYTIQDGRYQRIGNKCHALISLSWTGHTGTGSLTVTLPIPAAAGLAYAPVTPFNQGIPRAAGQVLQPVVRPGMSVIDFSFSEITGGVTFVNIQAAVTSLILYVCYEV